MSHMYILYKVKKVLAIKYLNITTTKNVKFHTLKVGGVKHILLNISEIIEDIVFV